MKDRLFGFQGQFVPWPTVKLTVTDCGLLPAPVATMFTVAV